MLYQSISSIEGKCDDDPRWYGYLAHLTNDEGTAILFA